MQRSLRPLKILRAHGAARLQAGWQHSVDITWPDVCSDAAADAQLVSFSGSQIWQGRWLSPAMSDLLQSTNGPAGCTSSTALQLQVSNQLLQHSLSTLSQTLAAPSASQPSQETGVPGSQPAGEPACSIRHQASRRQQFSSPLIAPGLHQPEAQQPEAEVELNPLQCSRGNTWQPSTNKRLNKHGLEKRLSTPEGRFTILNRIRKGRWRLTVDQVVGQRQDGGTRLK